MQVQMLLLSLKLTVMCITSTVARSRSNLNSLPELTGGLDNSFFPSPAVTLMLSSSLSDLFPRDLSTINTF